MKLASCLATLALASSAIAGVTINFNVDQVFTSGGAPVPLNGFGLIIADTTGDGFGAIQPGAISVGSLVGSSDYVLFASDFSTFVTEGVWSVSASNVSLAGSWGANDQLAFVWFPTVTAATSVSDGTQYGLITSASWLTPADGGSNPDTYQIISTTNNGYFTANPATVLVSNEQARAGLLVGVPEPSSFAALAGIAALGFASSRRRRV